MVKVFFICLTIPNWKYNLRTLNSCIYCRHTNKPKFSRITFISTPHTNGSWDIVIKMSNVDSEITLQTSKVKVHNSTFFFVYIYSFIHSIGMCWIRWLLAILRSFFHSSLLCTFSCHPSPPTILPCSLTSSCQLFLGILLNLFVPKLIYNTLLGILFSSILCTCPHQHNLFNLTVSITVGFLTLA